MVKKYLKSILCLGILLPLLMGCKNSKECSYITNYYQEVYRAEEAYYQKNYQQVFDILTDLSSTCDLLNQRGVYELSKFAESAAIIGEEDKAIEILQELILRGTTLDQIKGNESYTTLLQSKAWKEVEYNYDSLRTIHLQKVNVDLRQEISDMIHADQRERRLLRTTTNKDSLWKIINRTDFINEIKFKKIIADYGYPNESIIGGYSIDNQNINPGILLFHFDDYDYWAAILRELIEKGEAPPQSLGTFVDSYQRRVDTPKRFIYGIYDNSSEADIMDFDQLDERRMSIGLRPRVVKKRIDSLKRKFYGLD